LLIIFMNLANPANLIIAGLYIALVGILGFFAIFGVYVLIRYGKSTPLAVTISLLFSFIFLQILTQSYITLQKILLQ